MKQIYYKHMIIKTGDQDDVEKEINSYIEDTKKLGEFNLISLNVVPEKTGSVIVEGYALPKYWYHINLVYTCD